MEPRPYQKHCIEAAIKGFDQFDRQLVVMPTGAGKTCVFSWLAQYFQPARTLILAHREELIDQAIDKLHKATGIYAEKEKAEFSARPSAPVVVASVQTMLRRLDKWSPDHFGLIVTDEAHHAISKSWQTVLRHFSAKVLGVTATPDRGDKRNLGSYFENVAAEVTLFDLIHQNYLSRITLKSIPLQIDLNAVKQTAGDFDADQLGDALAPYLRTIAGHLREEVAFRRTLVFMPLIATSKTFVDECRRAGILAEHIDGYDEERREKLARFASGEIELLSNAMLLTEGFDDPGIDCVVVLRPTRSRALYSQMVGRGTRVARSKSNLLLLDFLWLHESHSLIRPAHLIASSNEFADEMTAAAEKTGGQCELDLEGLASETQQKRESRLREELAKKAKRKARVMDAVEFALSMDAHDAVEYEPAMKWEGEKISDAQRAVLERAGIDIESVTCKGHASKVIDLVITRSKQNLCTPKQMRLLKQLGHPSPATATFEQASAFLNVRLKRKEAA